MRTIKHFKHKYTKGFTLIELTIVMGIFIVIGTIIVSILNSTFTGNAKIRTTGDLSQNGNYALSIITNLLLSTQRFEGIVTTSPPCTPTTQTTCCSNTGTSGKSISFIGLDGGRTTLTCENTGSSPTYAISSASASFNIPLIDTTQARLSQDTSTCVFTCTQVDEYSPPRIDISFTLQNVADGSSANFRTSVSLRNQNLK